MNPADDQLDRLFQAASQAPSGPVAGPAYGLETRALAAWRTGRAGDTGFWDTALLVRGLIVAGAIMVISFVPALKSTETTSNPFAEFLQLTDSTIPSDETP